jgi:Putative lumazine-binding
MVDQAKDIAAIQAVIERQFASLSWRSGTSGDWDAFTADFLPDATLYPAARPARSQTVRAFVERMKSLSGTTLTAFHEVVLGTRIHVFGNVAVAIAIGEMIENNAEANRNVEMLLLLKSEGAWRIVAQAWDKVTPSNPIPEDLIAGTR